MLIQQQSDDDPHERNEEEDKGDNSFRLNDQVDIVVEILRRLDGRSLCTAACVCRLWSALVSSDDSIWEYLCFGGRQAIQPSSSPSPSLRRVVSVLGGHRRLYIDGVFPITARLGRCSGGLVWTPDHVVQLALSLISVDCYERLFLDARAGDATSASPAPGRTVLVPAPERRRRILLRCIS